VLHIFLTCFVGYALIAALLLSPAARFVIAAGWLLVTVGMVVIAGPIVLIGYALSCVGLVSDAPGAPR